MTKVATLRLRLMLLAASYLPIGGPGHGAESKRPCDPEQIVRAIYKTYASQPNQLDSKVILPYADRALARMIRKDMACREICVLDFVFLIDAQDYEYIRLTSAVPEPGGDGLDIRAEVDIGVAKSTIHFLFARTPQCTELTDVRITDDRKDSWSLRQVLADYHEPAKPRKK